MQRFASLSKLTLILARTSGSTLRPLLPRAPTPGVRFNSSNIPKQSPAGTKVDKYADHNDAMRDWQAPIVSYEQLKPKTESPDPNDYLIDVREPDEVIQGSIPSSVNLPLSEISTAFGMNEDAFKAKYGWDKPKRDQEIIFYCRSGKRSASAGDVAVRNGYKNVLNYQGSWLDWVSHHPQN